MTFEYRISRKSLVIVFVVSLINVDREFVDKYYIVVFLFFFGMIILEVF